ncbi:hypothetical protein QYF36_022949 [Acer negundo]|nr:hypothetical protein QYF36_022949 [Acer negundo]
MESRGRRNFDQSCQEIWTRSKGHLQRTGKSFRLGWVNKLRPNLKKARSHQQSLNLVHCLINYNNYDTIKMVPLPDLVLNPKLMDFDTTTDHARVEDLQISFPQVPPLFFSTCSGQWMMLLLNLLLLISSRF